MAGLEEATSTWLWRLGFQWNRKKFNLGESYADLHILSRNVHARCAVCCRFAAAILDRNNARPGRAGRLDADKSKDSTIVFFREGYFTGSALKPSIYVDGKEADRLRMAVGFHPCGARRSMNFNPAPKINQQP